MAYSITSITVGRTECRLRHGTKVGKSKAFANVKFEMLGKVVKSSLGPGGKRVFDQENEKLF